MVFLKIPKVCLRLDSGVAPETFRQRAAASDRGGGAEMTEKWCFRALFCQISSDENPKFPPTGGLDASDGGL